MTYQALRRLAKWLNKKSWWDDKEDLNAMQKDFMREVVTNMTLSNDEKVGLLAVLMYGEEKNDDE